MRQISCKNLAKTPVDGIYKNRQTITDIFLWETWYQGRGLSGIAGLIEPLGKKRGNYEPIKGCLLNPMTERYNKPIAVNTMARITRITMAIIKARHIAPTLTPWRTRLFTPFHTNKKLPRMLVKKGGTLLGK
jgi:hypothetical protein